MENDYKALIADIDGTLTKKGEGLLPKTRYALQALHERGLEIGLATGRPLDHRIFDRAKEWELGFSFDILIGMNGGELWDRYTGEIERSYMLEETTLKDILGFMMEADVNAIIFEEGYDRVLATRSDPNLADSIVRNHSIVEYVPVERLWQHPAGKLEFHYDVSAEDEVYRIADAHPDSRYIAVRTFPGTLEFLDPHVSKSIGLESYCRHRGISPEEVIACGDMENDITMMKAAGLGICLKNGSETARREADEVTEYPVTEDGLGRYLIQRFGL